MLRLQKLITHLICYPILVLTLPSYANGEIEDLIDIA